MNRKKVFMFANYTPADRTIGITKKINSEINTLRKLGYEVFYSAYDTDGVSIFDNNDVSILHKTFPFRHDKLNKAMRYYWLETTAYSFLQQNNNFTLGYIRLGPPNNMLFKILDLLKKGNAHIVVESLAYFPGIHYHSIQGKYIQAMHALNHKRFKNYVDCFLVEGNMTEMYNVPCYTMNMGVEVESIKPHKYRGDTSELNLISVANENVYHGYDRVIKSLHEYYKNNKEKNIRIHLVGIISDKTKALIDQFKLNEYVILYGKKGGEDLDRIYDLCNVGLGPFGQHRVGGKKDTGLKTKEYFAKGLPYIYSGEEPTVPPNYPYIKQFPSDESVIDFQKVWAFYETFCNEEEHVCEEMRRFAKQNYSWDSIMKSALAHVKLC